MERHLACSAIRRTAAVSHRSVRGLDARQSRRCFATFIDRSNREDFQAAPAIQFTADSDQFIQTGYRQNRGGSFRRNDDGQGPRRPSLLDRIRIVPASPSYFTAAPRFTDDILHLSALLRRFQRLPQIAMVDAPQTAWKTIDQYKAEVEEPVRETGFRTLLGLLKRLNTIHPSVVPVEVKEALEKYKRTVQPHRNVAKPILVDAKGRAVAVGRRKSSSAQVTLVEGDGQCLVNGRVLTDYFGRLHDRESAVWALKATGRLDKYNVWALASGGGTTGQAEAITLGLAKALLAHEPDLKPALRKAGCVTRDRRRVERKKPGKLKARKMPAWVKR